MFENEIKRIYNHNLNKVKSLGDYINFEQLISANLHPAILQYISAEIDYRIFEDRQKLLKNSQFDYSSQKIRDYLSQIGKELKKQKRFSSQYISKLILHAVSFNVNFLARPKWALIKFIFDEKQEKSSDEVKQILNYIHYYAFLKKILVLYIEKKGLLAITQSEFKELLIKIDESGIETNQSTIIDKALEAMSDFYNVGLQGKSLIPLPAARLYFREKNLQPMLNKINNRYAKDDNESHDLEEIKSALAAKDASIDAESEQMIKELVQESVFVKSDYSDEEEIQAETKAKAELERKESISEIPVESEPESEHPEETDEENFVESKNKNEIEEELEEKIEPAVKESSEKIFEDELEEGIVQRSVQDSSIFELNKSQKPAEIDEPEEHEEEVLPMEQNSVEDDNTDSLSEEDMFLSMGENIEEIADMTPKTKVDGQQLEDSELALSEDEEPEEPPAKKENKIEFEEEVIEIDEDEEMVNIFENVEEESEEEPADAEEREVSENPLEEPAQQATDEETLSDIMVEEFESSLTKIDMSDLLENKKMTKIIEVIFDYDMEDFTNTLDQISGCQNFDKANLVIDKLYDTNRINPKSKEAQVFKDLVSEYFD